MDVPAICACGAVWIASTLFKGDERTANTLTGCSIGPCPNCKGQSRIPDGKYRLLSAEIYDSEDARILANAFLQLHQKMAAGVPLAEVAKEIQGSPIFKKIAQFMPTDLTKLGLWVAILTSVLDHCSGPQSAHRPSVGVHPEIHQALQSISGAPPSIPPKSPS
jgi:hypothetical protein